MKIYATQPTYNNYIKQSNNKGAMTAGTNNNTLPNAYPSNYYVNFGVRNTSQVLNNFNGEIPVSVKNFLSEHPEFREKDLFTVHKIVYDKLKDCKNCDDVRKNFPKECTEGYWKNIKDIRNNNKQKTDSPAEVIVKNFDEEKAGCNLTVFLLKNLFLDGQTKIKLMDIICNDYLKDFENKKEFLAKIQNKQSTVKKYSLFNSLRNLSGIAFPNWKEYGFSVSYENRKEAERKEDERAKYPMIDAWIQCPNIREELSVFLIKQYKISDSLSLIEKTNIFSNNDEFWDKHPEFKKQFGEELKRAQEKYDTIASSGDTELYKNYKRDLEKKSEEITKSIQLEHIRLKNKEFPFASTFILELAEKINPLYIKSITRVDLYELLSAQFDKNEKNIIENSDSDSVEFKKLFNNDIKYKITKVKYSGEFSNLVNSEKIALLSDLIENDEIMQDNLKEDLPELINYSIIESSKNISKLSEIKEIYNNNKNAKNSDSNSQIVENLKNFAEFSGDETETLNNFIEKQGKYSLNVLSDNKQLSLLTSVLLLNEYDRINGTNHKNELLDSLDEKNKEKLLDDVLKQLSDETDVADTFFDDSDLYD